MFDRSLVYYSCPADRINPQVIYRFNVVYKLNEVYKSMFYFTIVKKKDYVTVTLG